MEPTKGNDQKPQPPRLLPFHYFSSNLETFSLVVVMVAAVIVVVVAVVVVVSVVIAVVIVVAVVVVVVVAVAVDRSSVKASFNILIDWKIA